jgi:energy-coupling factor transport system permease protein
MDEFEFLRDITIGQYLPADTRIHRLDPRAKLLTFVALLAAVTFTASYLGNLILIVVILWLLALARIPLAYALAGLRPALPFILVLALLQLLFSPVSSSGSPVILSVGFLTVTADGARLVVVSIARFAELFLAVSLLTLTTTTTELAHGQESLLSPLSALRLPVHEFALTMTIAMRFVPIMAEETERLMKAQISRGADFGGANRLRFIQQTRKMIPLLVPLFIAGLQRAEELIVAMEARGYLGGRGRTRFVELNAAAGDFVVVIIAVVFAVLMLVAKFPF